MSNPHITETDSLSCVELSFCQSVRASADLLHFRMTSSALCALRRDERMNDGGMERKARGGKAGWGNIYGVMKDN